MKEVLDTIDSARNRRVSPTAMLVAAALLTRGLDKPGSNTFVIHGLIFLLVVYAFGYLAFSAAVAIKEFDELGLRFWQKGVFGLSFMLLYLVLFVAAIYFGLGKIA